jgi:hypothetical protein
MIASASNDESSSREAPLPAINTGRFARPDAPPVEGDAQARAEQRRAARRRECAIAAWMREFSSRPR